MDEICVLTLSYTRTSCSPPGVLFSRINKCFRLEHKHVSLHSSHVNCYVIILTINESYRWKFPPVAWGGGVGWRKGGVCFMHSYLMYLKLVL